MTAPLGKPQTSSAPSTQRHAFAAVMAAAVLWALAPPIVHLSAVRSNPFYFNMVVVGVEACLLTVLLCCSADRYLRVPLHKISGLDERSLEAVKRLGTYLSFFARPRGETTMTLHTLDARSCQTFGSASASIVRLPLLWSTAGTLHYALFAWSTQHIETAIATTIYELWPFLFILLLARHHRIDEAYRLGGSPNIAQGSHVSVGRVVALSAAAAVGLALASASQYDTISVGSLSWSNTKGIILSAAASALNALWVTGTLIHGKTIYYRIVGSSSDDADGVKPWSGLPVNTRSRDHRRLLLWSTVMGIAAARLSALPATLILGWVFFDGHSPSPGLSLTAHGLTGGVILGVVGASSASLRRYGDIAATGPGVHALAFLTPPLSLLLLWTLGIDLPHRGMFAAGAALIVASNIFIQSNQRTV